MAVAWNQLCVQNLVPLKNKGVYKSPSAMLGFQIKKIWIRCLKQESAFCSNLSPVAPLKCGKDSPGHCIYQLMWIFLDALVHLKLHQTSDFMHMEGTHSCVGI